MEKLRRQQEPQCVPQHLIETSLLEKEEEDRTQSQHIQEETAPSRLDEVALEVECVFEESEDDVESSFNSSHCSLLDNSDLSQTESEADPSSQTADFMDLDAVVSDPDQQVPLLEAPLPQHSSQGSARKRNKSRRREQRWANRRLARGTHLSTKEGSYLRLATINLRVGFLHRLALVQKTILEDKLDVICCTETGLRQKPKLPQGLLYCGKPVKSGETRGIGIIIRKTVPHIDLSSTFEAKELEVAIVGVTLKEGNFAICAAYLPPRDKETMIRKYREMEVLTNNLRSQGWSPIWAGDFNSKIGDDEFGISGNHPRIDAAGRELRRFVRANDFYIANRSPHCMGLWTRTENDSRSVLDYILLDETLAPQIKSVFVDENKERNLFSDHCLVWADLFCSLPVRNSKRTGGSWRIPSKHQLVLFRQFLDDALKAYVENEARDLSVLDEVAKGQVITSEMEQISSAIVNAAERWIGFKCEQDGLGSIPVDVRVADNDYKQATKAYKRALIQNAPQQERTPLWIRVRQCKRLLKEKLIKNAQQEVRRYTTLAQNTKSNTPLWKFRKSLHARDNNRLPKPVRRDEGAGIVADGERVKEIVEDYANKLYGVHEVPGNTYVVRPPPVPRDVEDSLLFDPLTSEVLQSYIQNLKKLKSPGPDRVTNDLIQGGGTTLHAAILKLFNRVLQSRTTPSSWGESEIVMLLKRGDATLLDNYRGIALGNTIGKLFCSIMNDRLVMLLEEHDIFGKIQFGFRKDHRSSDALFILSQTLQHRRAQGLDSYLAFLDLKKAYDLVDRSLLWQRLRKVGLSEDLVLLLKSLYRDTWTRVQFGSTISDPVLVESGVKQGCPLSPTLFNIFISGLVDDLQLSGLGIPIGQERVPALFFADDVVLLAQSAVELDSLLGLAGNFATDQNMVFNGPKSRIVPVTDKHRIPRSWSVQGAPIFEVSEADISEGGEYEYLGILVSSDLYPFSRHEASVLKKMKREGESLLYMFPQALGKVALQDLVWRHVVLSSLTYAAEVQTPSSSFLVEMEALQRDIGRRVLRAHVNPAAPSIAGDLGWLHPKTVFHSRILTFWGRLATMPQDRLVARVFQEFRASSPPSSWFSYSQQLLHDYGLKEEDLSSRGRISLKTFVKKCVKGKAIQEWSAAAQKKSTLRFMVKSHTPRLGKFLDGSASGYWFHRARTDTLMVNSRRFPRGSKVERCCQSCPGKKDSLEHALIHCPMINDLRDLHFPTLSRELGADIYAMSDEERMLVLLGFHSGIRDHTYTTQRKFLLEVIAARGIPFYSTQDTVGPATD